MLSPFRGLLFDPAVVGDVGAAVSPPYDVIDADQQRALEAQSPFNIVRLLLGSAGDPTYAGAARLFAAWRTEGALVPDETSRLYAYTMEYTAPDGSARVARGVLGGLDLLPLGERVLPHEETMAKHRADRLAVLAATQANLDVIIALSSSPDLAPQIAAVIEGPPRLEVAVDGVIHRVFDVVDPDRIGAIKAAVADHAVSIADGHHRYTTALGYRATRDESDGPGPWDQILAFVAPAEGSGLTIGPYHRVFATLDFDEDAVADAFQVSEPERLPQPEAGGLVVATAARTWLLTPRPGVLEGLPGPWRQASPAVARELLYPRLGISEDDAEYMADGQAAVDAVAEGRFGAAILVAPVTEHAIAEASDAGLRFPQKTTFFVPKPRAGLVVRAFDV